MQHTVIEDERRRHAERREIGQRVQMAAEGPAHRRPPRDVAVHRVEHRGDPDGGQGCAQPAVAGQHHRQDAGREAAGGEQVGGVDELPHVVACAVR